MPLYEYRCEQCNELFEVMQKFTDEPLSTHEKCGGRVHRLLSAPALQFKGSGWYITDYARNTEKAANGAAKKDEGKKDDKAATPASSESGTNTPATTTTSSSEKTKSDS
jgi:putative FmdB family regulatory protein